MYVHTYTHRVQMQAAVLVEQHIDALLGVAVYATIMAFVSNKVWHTTVLVLHHTCLKCTHVSACLHSSGHDDSVCRPIKQQHDRMFSLIDFCLLQVNQVRLRIAGHNPVGIICTEAHAWAVSKHNTAAWPAIERALTGRGAATSRSSLRRQLPQQGLVRDGAEHVAELLLELATDECILARTWEGWRPWL